MVYTICLFLATRTRKIQKKKHDSFSYLLVYTAVKLCSTGKIKSNPLEPYFQT